MRKKLVLTIIIGLNFNFALAAPSPEQVAQALALSVSRDTKTLPADRLTGGHLASGTPLRTSEDGLLLGKNLKTGEESVVGYVTSRGGEKLVVMGKDLYNDLAGCDCVIPGASAGLGGDSVSTPMTNPFRDNIDLAKESFDPNKKKDALSTPKVKGDGADIPDEKSPSKNDWVSTPFSKDPNEVPEHGDFYENLKKRQEMTGSTVSDKEAEAAVKAALNPTKENKEKLQKEKEQREKAEHEKAVRDALGGKGNSGSTDRKMHSDDAIENNEQKYKNSQKDESNKKKDSISSKEDQLLKQRDQNRGKSQAEKTIDEMNSRKNQNTEVGKKEQIDKMMRDAGLETKEEAKKRKEKEKSSAQESFEDSLRPNQRNAEDLKKQQGREELSKAKDLQEKQQKLSEEQARIKEEKEKALKEQKKSLLSDSDHN